MRRFRPTTRRLILLVALAAGLLRLGDAARQLRLRRQALLALAAASAAESMQEGARAAICLRLSDGSARYALDEYAYREDWILASGRDTEADRAGRRAELEAVVEFRMAYWLRLSRAHAAKAEVHARRERTLRRAADRPWADPGPGPGDGG